MKGVKYLQKKRKTFSSVLAVKDKLLHKPLISRLNYTMYFMKHPIDGCYGVRREFKASYASANLLLAVFMVVYLVNKYATGFILKTVMDGRFDIFTDVLYLLGIFLLMTACTYLISTINDGEGTFKQLYTAFVYALGPYMIIKPLVIVISNIITYNEVFLVKFSNFCMYTWVVILLFLAVKEINNYTVKETVKVILLTFFCALIAALLLFILYVLVSQVKDFAQAIYGEVVYRLE
jgi:hypothetical protein